MTRRGGTCAAVLTCVPCGDGGAANGAVVIAT
jgi:hypothetical protein